MRAVLAALLLCATLQLAHAETCIASVYSTKDKDQPGSRTASGIALDDVIPTVAHKTLPLRSYVHVTNLGNGKSSVMRLTDRGPYIAGRCIDLSVAAAILLGCKGLCQVKVQ